MKFYFLKGYGNTYAASRCGLLKGKQGRLLSPYKEKTGYLTVVIFHKGIQKTWLIHRLIALQFIPNPKNKPQVNHKNGVKTDNRVENLEWVTEKENQRHAYNTGLMTISCGEDHQSSKLSKDAVIDIFTSGKSMKELVKKYGVGRGNIYAIQSRRSWTSVTNGLIRKLPKISQDRVDRNLINL